MPHEPQTDDIRWRRLAIQQLRQWHDAGVQWLPRRTTPTAVQADIPAEKTPALAQQTAVADPQPYTAASPVTASLPARPNLQQPEPPAIVQEPLMPVVSKAERGRLLDEIRCEVEACTLCRELVANRSRTVFGVGNLKPRVVFFGEAPGADEDAQGEPFVGKAGQLLNKIIEACTWKREDVYILNVLKCRPPNNRPPTDDEAANCRPFFERQLAILRPEYIVCLGASAAKALLQTPLSIGKLRGKLHTYRDAQVVATYHPAYLLRNPDAKRFVWDDMKMLLKEMGISLPAK